MQKSKYIEFLFLPRANTKWKPLYKLNHILKNALNRCTSQYPYVKYKWVLESLSAIKKYHKSSTILRISHELPIQVAPAQ